MKNKIIVTGMVAPPASLHQHAEDNLKYIRDTMELAVLFTGLSGKGYVIAGLSALAATWLAARQATTTEWLAVWMLELVFAAAVNLAMTSVKTRRQGGSLWSITGMELLLAFVPSLAVGGIVTAKLYIQGDVSLLPGMWMCICGAAVITAGVHSVRVIPVMGAIFMLMGIVVLFTTLPANTMLGLGMGVLHVVFGTIVWRNHGG